MNGYQPPVDVTRRRPHSLPVVAIGALRESTARRLLDEGRGREPTSGDRTVSSGVEPAPDAFVRTRVVGHGSDDFAAASAALRSLRPQRSVARVLPVDAEAVAGATVLVVLAIGPLTLVAVNRVVWLVDEPDRWGFAYATLPGHPERGQESFEVVLRNDGSVVATVVGRGIVALPWGQVLQPLLRPLQERFAERYLDAVGDAVAECALLAQASR